MKKALTDLTQGKVWKQLVKYSAPLVLSSVLQAMYGIVDTIVAGKFVGSGGISAINNSGQIIQLITQIIIGLTTGGNILIGQYFGNKDMEKCKSATVTLFSVSMIMGAAIAVIFYVLARPILIMLDAPSLDDAVTYLQICSIGLFFIFGYNALSSAIRAVGNSRQPLICIASTTAVNIVLDLLLVGVFKMDIAGAAIATVIAQGISFIIALIYTLMHYDIFGLCLRRLYIHKNDFKIMMKLGLPCAVQMSIAGISWLSVTYIVNGYGVHISAGNGISNKIKELCQLFITAMANAAAAMIAQNIGAKKYDRAKSVMYSAMKITVVMSLVLIAIVEIFAPQLVSIFSTDIYDSAAAVENLRIEIIGQLFYAIFLVYHSLAIGAGHTMFAFISSFVNCILVRMVLSFTLNHFFGITGLYLACMIAPSSSVPIGFFYVRSDRWKRSTIKETASITES